MEERWKTGRTEDGRMLLCGANSYEQKYILTLILTNCPSPFRTSCISFACFTLRKWAVFLPYSLNRTAA